MGGKVVLGTVYFVSALVFCFGIPQDTKQVIMEVIEAVEGDIISGLRQLSTGLSTEQLRDTVKVLFTSALLNNKQHVRKLRELGVNGKVFAEQLNERLLKTWDLYKTIAIMALNPQDFVFVSGAQWNLLDSVVKEPIVDAATTTFDQITNGKY